MPLSSPTLIALPCLTATWVATLLVITKYRIAQRVLDKTEPHRLPEVLHDLNSLFNGGTQTLTDPSSHRVQPPSAPTGQNESTTAEPDREAQ